MAACKKQADAQSLHADARYDFMLRCLRPHKKT
jgi:psiF repeat